MSDAVQVLITIPFADETVEQLRAVSSLLDINVVPARLPEEIPAEVWEQTEVLYTMYALPEPERAPNLRWVQFHMAGVDRVIDADILRQPEVVATTLSGANAPQVAEYVLTMMLALCHHLPALLSHQARSQWPTKRFDRFTPRELRHSTIGIVGYGSVGRQVAHLLHRFNATLLASKRDAMNPEDRGYAPKGTGDPHGELPTRLYPGQALRSMFQECDFVVVTVPLTESTRGMVGADQLAALKPNTFLIDVSRGGVLDHKALLEALNQGKIAGAALDVFPEEPLPADSPLWEMPNVILTPHIAGAAPDYNQRAAELFGENLHRYLNEKPLYNLIDLERGY